MGLQTIDGNATVLPPQGFALTNLPETAQRIELKKNESHRMTGSHRWEVIACEQGRVWITQECDLRDYVLNTGEAFLVTMPGKIAVKALRDSVVIISKSVKQKPFSGSFRSEFFK